MARREVEVEIEVSAPRERRDSSESFRPQMIVEGQPRGLRGPSDMEIDGNVLGHRSGFSYATMREKEHVDAPDF